MPYALDPRGRPIFLVSSMAMHTQNLNADPRTSLFVTQPNVTGDPLGAARVTLMGKVDPAGPEARSLYLKAHENAQYWIDFDDFSLIQLEIHEVYYIGGFGVMGWISAEDYAHASPDPLADAAPRIVEHMNADHADAQVLFCRHLLGRPENTEATMSAVDRYGFEMIAVSPGGRASVRLGFAEECTTGEQVRHAMVELVGVARAAAAG
jgi:heme iron utilization protein